MALDPSILLQSRPVDLNELGDSLNPATIYQNGLKIRQQKQQLQTEGLQQQVAQTQLSEQQRQIAQDKAIRETYSKADMSTPEGVHAFLESIKANPLTADKYPDAVKSVVEQGQNQAKLSGIQEYAKLYGPTSNAPANSGVIGNPGVTPTQGIQGSYQPQQAQVQPQVDLSQKIVGLKNKSAYETYLGLPPKSAPELNQAYLDAQKAADSDLNSTDWMDKIHSIPPGKLGDAQILHTQFVDSHPYIRQLPKEQQDQIEKAFVAPQQPNMTMLYAGQMEGLPSKNVDSIVDQLHNRTRSLDDVISHGRYFGNAAEIVRQQVLDAYKQKTGEDYDPSAATAGQKFQQSPKITAYVSAMDNARSTLQALQSEINKTNDISSQGVQRIANRIKSEFDDANATGLAATAGIAQEELGPAYARGGQVTDKARDLAAALDPSNRNPEAAKVQINAMLQGIDRNRTAVENGSYGFIKPPKYSRTGDTQQHPISVNDPSDLQTLAGKWVTTPDGQTFKVKK